MSVKVTYYLEVISSWCYWAEPAWAELKRRYAGQAEFGWKIAQMPPEAYPQSKTQCDWFYRRSGAIMRSPFMLNSSWFEQELKEYERLQSDIEELDERIIHARLRVEEAQQAQHEMEEQQRSAKPQLADRLRRLRLLAQQLKTLRQAEEELEQVLPRLVRRLIMRGDLHPIPHRCGA